MNKNNSTARNFLSTNKMEFILYIMAYAKTNAGLIKYNFIKLLYIVNFYMFNKDKCKSIHIIVLSDCWTI